jgi:putative tributyrin esterase
VRFATSWEGLQLANTTHHGFYSCLMPSLFPTVELSVPALTPVGVHFLTVQSPALGRRADLCLYLPPSAATDALPLVTLLHGVYGSHWAWLFKGGAHQVLERLITDEGLPPMALAMPSDGLWGDGSGYLRHLDADYRRWIVQEVPAAAALVSPSLQQNPQFLCGLSMGGYGALRLGALYPSQYTAISAHSSVTNADDLQQFILEGSGPFHLAEDEPLSAIQCLQANAAKLPPLRFDCGLDDNLLEANRQLHTDLQQAGISHHYEEFPGGHTWDYWHEHLADSLRFFVANLIA